MADLTAEEDQDLRAYAVWLSPNDGEDAYHDAIVQTLTHPKPVKCVPAFYRTAIKRALLNIWRHARREGERVRVYTEGGFPKRWIGLAAGRLPRTHCRNGHEYQPETERYVKRRRICLLCAAQPRKHRNPTPERMTP